MEMSAWGALVAFVVASTITPGPNSIMIVASGVNFGFRRTLPHITGVALGMVLVISFAGMGLGALLEAIPALRWALVVASTLYLLFLAWKIATAAPRTKSEQTGRPLSFLQAASFQAVNPKVWALGMAAVALFAPNYTASNIVRVALTFACVGLISNTLWGWLGTSVARFLSTGKRLQLFNRTAAIALVASLVPVFFLE